MSDESKCGLCGDPMPKGEEMFKYHGYSGPCQKPPLQKPAVSVIDEAANEYYANYENIPQSLRKRISCEMLNNIFKKMVVPAIDKVRSLDRQDS